MKVFIYSLPISLLYAKAASAAVSCKAYYYTFPLVKFTFADDAKNVLRPSATPTFPSVFVLPGGFWRSPDVYYYLCFVVVVWLFFFSFLFYFTKQYMISYLRILVSLMLLVLRLLFLFR